MKVRLLVAGVLSVLVAVSAMAQGGISGKWNANIDTPQGPIAFVFDLKADGGTVTGTMSNEFMGAMPISAGTVSGKDVAFKVRIEGGPAGAMTINYKGTVDGDSLKLTSTFEGGAPEGAPAESVMTAARAK